MKTTLSTLLLFICFTVSAQIGINTNSPQGTLDIVSDTSTLVLPRNTDPTGNVTNPVAGMLIYNTTQNVLQYYDGTKWNTLQFFATSGYYAANEGTVKILSGSGGALPTLTISSGSGTQVYHFMNYTTPLTYDPAGTNWPANDRNPGDTHIVSTNSSGNTVFLENSVLGQVTLWRIVIGYSGKSNGTMVTVTGRMSNTAFTFEQSTTATGGETSGTLDLCFVTIANPQSLPAYGGTGYTFELKADNSPITLTIQSIARISFHKD